MWRHSVCRVVLSLLAAALLAACGTARAPTPSGEASAGVEGVVTVIVPIAGVVEPDNIILQFDWLGGMVLPYAWGGDLPELTLLDGGTLIYLDERAMAVQLTQSEAQSLIRQVLDLGFERLESYGDQCQTGADGTSLCIYDATTSSLRLRMPDGELREVQNYAEFANDPDALRAIRAFLTDYRNSGAKPYTPEKAVLYIRAIGDPGDLQVLDWSLDPALLRMPAGANTYCARVLARSDAETLAALPRQSMGFQYFRLGSQVWEVVLVPWLPGADYTAALAADGRLCPAPAPTGAPTSPRAATPTRSSSPGSEWSPLPAFLCELDSAVDCSSPWERARRSPL
jgi:hypothetical protein